MSDTAFEHRIAELLLSRRPTELPPIALADVLDRLIWVTRDNGAGIAAARERWLLGNDSYAIEVALRMNETFPFRTLQEMETVLSLVEKEFPQFSSLCRDLVNTRKQSSS